jgi:hypothetical protein
MLSEIHFQRVFSHRKYGFTLGKLVYSAAARRATACPQATHDSSRNTRRRRRAFQSLHARQVSWMRTPEQIDQRK